ncbi:hypothetical protein EGW08_007746 [Elysia chlorotica]|uniref:Uncharacterized protein n=1 Tax=Elysia chlorotica TaxID=188477 RepID=A0A3S1C6S9_ELYCH|nr:hypothetical protein EGW08_007746 [Elysia chlorotica]
MCTPIISSEEMLERLTNKEFPVCKGVFKPYLHRKDAAVAMATTVTIDQWSENDLKMSSLKATLGVLVDGGWVTEFELGGYLLQQNVGGHPVAVFRFPPRTKFAADSTITVWAAMNDPHLSQPAHALLLARAAEVGHRSRVYHHPVSGERPGSLDQETNTLQLAIVCRTKLLLGRLPPTVSQRMLLKKLPNLPTEDTKRQKSLTKKFAWDIPHRLLHCPEPVTSVSTAPSRDAGRAGPGLAMRTRA